LDSPFPSFSLFFFFFLFLPFFFSVGVSFFSLIWPLNSTRSFPLFLFLPLFFSLPEARSPFFILIERDQARSPAIRRASAIRSRPIDHADSSAPRPLRREKATTSQHEFEPRHRSVAARIAVPNPASMGCDADRQHTLQRAGRTRAAIRMSKTSEPGCAIPYLRHHARPPDNKIQPITGDITS